jgi:hypothetical protein
MIQMTHVRKTRMQDVFAVPLEERGASVEMTMQAEPLTRASVSSSQGCKCTSCTNLHLGLDPKEQKHGICYFANVPVAVERPLHFTPNYKLSYSTYLSMLS